MNEFLSIKEAMVFADIFDKMGETHNADVMDEYIRKMGEANGDIIKQAGLFRNMLRRLVGFGKKVFFKVYRELYEKAQEAQKLLDNRVKEINDQYNQIRDDLRNYDLEGWRGRIYALNLSDSKNIMRDFDASYGKLVQYLGITGESEEKDVGEKSQIEKLPNIIKEEPESVEEEVEGEKPEYWTRMTPGAKEGWNEVARSVAFNPSQGSLRIDKNYFNYLLGKHLKTDGAGNVSYYSVYSTKQQPIGGKLKEMMGEDEWETKEIENYVYLTPKTRGLPVGAPPVETPEVSVEEEPKFEAPKLPKPEGYKEPAEIPIEEEEKPVEVPEEEILTPIEEIKEEEKPVEVPETKEELPEEITEEEKPAEKPKEEISFLPRETTKNYVWFKKKPRRKGGKLLSRYSKILENTANKNQKALKGEIVEDTRTTSILDKLIPAEVPGHKPNTNIFFLPADQKELKEQMDLWEKNISEKE